MSAASPLLPLPTDGGGIAPLPTGGTTPMPLPAAAGMAPRPTGSIRPLPTGGPAPWPTPGGATPWPTPASESPWLSCSDVPLPRGGVALVAAVGTGTEFGGQPVADGGGGMLPLTGSPLPTPAGSGRDPQPSPRPATGGKEMEASISFVVLVHIF